MYIFVVVIKDFSVIQMRANDKNMQNEKYNGITEEDATNDRVYGDQILIQGNSLKSS